MEKKLPARPNLEHLRSQAKSLLSRARNGDQDAVQTFIEHLPAAQKMKPDPLRTAEFRLADAQSAIARKSGFASWASLTRHVDQLRAFEGIWEFVSLEIEGTAMPANSLSNSRIMMDGDRFRMESPEAIYEGNFTIDAEQNPAHLNIEFVEGPEAGNWSYGIYELKGDNLKICLGLTGASRPNAFKTTRGSGHALEHLRRASSSRPSGVEGGHPQPVAKPAIVDASEFEVRMTPLLERLQGEWIPVEMVSNGQAVPKNMLSMGKRIATGNEIRVVFGGQTMVHARIKIDETQSPIAIDYLNLNGSIQGKVSFGIMKWAGEEVVFCMTMPGAPRPDAFTSDPGSGRTLTRWRLK